jgi:hypothetical protein
MALDERRARFKNKLWERVEDELLGKDVEGQKLAQEGFVEQRINKGNVEVFEGKGVYTKLVNISF